MEKRFILLNDHYTSDLERLDFVNEGKQLIEQFKGVGCPICGNQSIQNKIDDPKKVSDSLASENKKIILKQKELGETLEQLDKDKTDLKNELNVVLEEFEEINKYIKNKLKPVAEINHQKLGDFISLKEDKIRLAILNEEIGSLEENKNKYLAQLNKKEKFSTGKNIPLEAYNKLTDEAKEIISNWGIECNKIEYDFKDNDIIINGKPRKHYGKGFRAIYLTAFIIALASYCIKNDKPHPGFLIIDSPLTTYKEKDKSNEKNEEKLSEEIQNSFFEYLSEYNKTTNMQIIVLDNKDPSEETKKKIKYEHFTRNKDFGRYGFFPL